MRTGYDRAAEHYLAMRPVDGADMALLEEILAELPERSKVLDAGCGAGVPVTRRLVAAGHRVTGLDLSGSQLALARRRVAGAGAVQGDLAALPFASGRFDALVSFYAVIHVPRLEHGRVFAEIRRVLAPGGRALLCLGTGDNPDDLDPDGWFGVPMYWSHYDAATSLDMLRACGLSVAWGRDVPDPMGHGAHRFVLARRVS